MLKIFSIFKKKPTKEQAQAKLYNDLATLSLIQMSLEASKKK
jgi:hypothetical protein